MSGSGLVPVQTWLWSELDDLGIDGVIYSRHILDLLISSKHTMDYLLAKKEQNIFSKIAPSGKKRKHKYSRRSSSFSACEEILWKKEIAVTCLLSAVDANADSGDATSTIQQVVDELYVKLSGLNLTPDAKKATSDDDYVNTGHKPMRRARKKENYEDAFPSLDGSNMSPTAANPSVSIWHKSSRDNESKSECDSDNPSTKPPSNLKSTKGSSLKTELASGDLPHSKPKRGLTCSWARNYHSDEDVLQLNNKVDINDNTTSFKPSTKTNQAKSRSSPGQTRFEKRMKPLHKSNQDQAGNSQSRRHARSRYGHTSRYGRRNDGNRFRGETNRKSRANRNNGRSNGKNSEEKRANPRKDSARDGNSATKQPSRRREKFGRAGNEQQYVAHLPSWMETTLIDVSSQVYFNNQVCWMPGDMQSIHAESPDPVAQEMAFSSKWYRDPESGLLTFHPSKARKERSNTDSHSSGSDVEEECLELCEKGPPSAPENWMWCPSPSLWEDGQTSPISRLQSVYKREMLAFDAAEEDYVDDISCRIWEEYKTIFLDLQDMNGGSDAERKESSDVIEKADGESDSFVDPLQTSSNDFKDKAQKDDDFVHISLVDTIDCGRRSFSPSSCVLCSSSGNSNSSSSLLHSASSETISGSIPISSQNGLADDVWKYSSVSDGWSCGDDRRLDDIQKGRNEVSKLLEWALGQSNDSLWKEEPLSHPSPDPVQQQELWGGGDMLLTKKPSPEVSLGEEEKAMNFIVDAMFSDLQSGLDDQDEALDCFGVFDRRRNSVGVLTTPQSWTGNPADLFDSGCNYQLFSVDIQSLYLHSPIHNQDFDPWNTKFKMDELFDNQRPIASIPNLDSFLASITGLNRSIDRGPAGNRVPGHPEKTQMQKKTFLDSVTENDAWKTSLRIGNIWQNISGIRPVNVIYSENKLESDGQVIPSSQTHFRPISTPLEQAAVELNPENYNQADSSFDNCDTGNMQELNTSETTEMNAELSQEPNFQMNFSKLVQDKSMQTSFGIKVEKEISDCAQLYSGLPKANSR